MRGAPPGAGRECTVKILNVITRLDRGGSSEDTLYIVQRINGAGITNELVSGPTQDSDNSISRFVSEHGIRLLVNPHLKRVVNPLSDLRAFLWLYRHMKRSRYDVVHTHTSKAGLLGRWAAWCAGVRHIIHTPHGHVYYGYYGPVFTALIRLIESLTARITSTITVLTPTGKTEHLQCGVGRPGQLAVVHSGVAIEELRPDPAVSAAAVAGLGIPAGCCVIGTVTRLVPIKDNTTLIAAFAQVHRAHPETVLVIVGSGPERMMLEQLAQGQGVADAVRFLGLRDDVTRVWARCWSRRRRSPYR